MKEQLAVWVIAVREWPQRVKRSLSFMLRAIYTSPTWRAIQNGTYDYTAITGVLVAVAGLVVDAAAQASDLPTWVQPYVVAAAPYARLITLVGGVVAAHGRSLLVRQ